MPVRAVSLRLLVFVTVPPAFAPMSILVVTVPVFPVSALACIIGLFPGRLQQLSPPCRIVHHGLIRSLLLLLDGQHWIVGNFRLCVLESVGVL